MARLLYRTGMLAATRRLLFLGGWLVLLAGVVVLVNVYGSNTNDSFSLPGTDSEAAKDLLASQFPPEQNGTSPIVFHTTTGKVTDAANKEAIEASHAAITALPDVYSATDPFSQGGQAQVSKDGTTAYIPCCSASARPTSPRRWRRASSRRPTRPSRRGCRLRPAARSAASCPSPRRPTAS